MSEADANATDAQHSAWKRSSVHGVAATFVGQGLRFVLQFGSQVLLARLLVPSDFGLLAMVGPLLGFIAVFTDLGLTQATVQRAEISQAELSSLFWINVAIAAACAAGLSLAAPAVAAFYGEPRLVPIVVCLSALLVVSGAAAQHVALMERRMRFRSLAVMDTGSTVLTVAAGLGAAALGWGFWSLVAMQAVNALAILAIAWCGSGWMPSAPSLRTGGMRGLLQFGGHLTAYNIVNTLGLNLDTVLLGRLSGTVAVGVYDRASKLVVAPMGTISMPLARVAVTLLSRLEGAAVAYRLAFVELLEALLVVTVPAVAFVAAMAGVVVPALLGPGWGQAAPVVTWLAVATGFAPLSIAAYWLFVSQGRPAELSRYALWGTLMRIAAILAGVGWGAVGIAVALAVSAPLVHGLPLWGAARRGPVRQADWLRGCYPMLLAGCVAWVAVRLVDHPLQGSGWPVVVRLAIDAAASYVACMASLLCLPEGNRQVRSLWALRQTFRPSVPAQ